MFPLPVGCSFFSVSDHPNHQHYPQAPAGHDVQVTRTVQSTRYLRSVRLGHSEALKYLRSHSASVFAKDVAVHPPASLLPPTTRVGPQYVLHRALFCSRGGTGAGEPDGQQATERLPGLHALVVININTSVQGAFTILHNILWHTSIQINVLVYL